jgi:hypothetical protein
MEWSKEQLISGRCVVVEERARGAIAREGGNASF